jgi:hypothetical protein
MAHSNVCKKFHRLSIQKAQKLSKYSARCEDVYR